MARATSQGLQPLQHLGGGEGEAGSTSPNP